MQELFNGTCAGHETDPFWNEFARKATASASAKCSSERGSLRRYSLKELSMLTWAFARHPRHRPEGLPQAVAEALQGDLDMAPRTVSILVWGQ